MKRLPSALPLHGVQVDLPTVVEELLVDVATDGFTLYCCGPKTAPNALVAAYEWEQYVDLLTIRDFDRVTTARVPTHGRVDIFAPGFDRVLRDWRHATRTRRRRGRGRTPPLPAMRRPRR
jgi:hypothetical protein